VGSLTDAAASWSAEVDLDGAVDDLVARDAVEVPPYPAVAMKIERLVGSGDFGLDELARLATSDQALAADVLRCANTAAFARGAPVASVPQAVARIGAGELRALIDGGERPAIVDVRSHSVRKLDPRFIPGALAMDIGEVDAHLGELPAESEIVFYCSCPNEASAAQVAKKLIGLGYTRVRPLHGGLDAWIAAGYEVEERAVGSTQP